MIGVCAKNAADGFLTSSTFNHQNAMHFMTGCKGAAPLLLAGSLQAEFFASLAPYSGCGSDGFSPPSTLRVAGYCAIPGALIPSTLGRKAELHSFIHAATAVDMLHSESREDSHYDMTFRVGAIVVSCAQSTPLII